MAVMAISRTLNITFQVELESGATMHVHATPIKREVWDTYFMVLSRAFAELYGARLNVVAGPRLGMRMLRQVATQMGVMDDVQKGLINEMLRMTNVMLVPPGTDQGWQTLPYDVVRQQNFITDEDCDEVENMVAFFTISYYMFPRKQRAGILAGMAFWGAETSSSTATDLYNSLKTSTREESSGEKVAPSSVPY